MASSSKWLQDSNTVSDPTDWLGGPFSFLKDLDSTLRCEICSVSGLLWCCVWAGDHLTPSRPFTCRTSSVPQSQSNPALTHSAQDVSVTTSTNLLHLALPPIDRVPIAVNQKCMIRSSFQFLSLKSQLKHGDPQGKSGQQPACLPRNPRPHITSPPCQTSIKHLQRTRSSKKGRSSPS